MPEFFGPLFPNDYTDLPVAWLRTAEELKTPSLCQTDKRGKKVLQTILASLYTPSLPLRAMPMYIWKQHIFQKGADTLTSIL